MSGTRRAGSSMPARVLVVNAGSSSIKLSLLDECDRTIAHESLPTSGPDARADAGRLRSALSAPLREADAVGHRIVHGGERFREATLVDDSVEAELRALGDLAPLHQIRSLSALDAVRALLPQLPTVACFDTAFHATLPAAARTYALPEQWRARHPVRRFGFHGLSHAWVARRSAELLGRDPAGLAIISCHLGAGASLCAIEGGRSRDTTMGFTPLEGLVMATRSGSVDPGMLLWLMERDGSSAREVGEALEHRSGLLGLAGVADMREVLERAQAAEERAQLALEVYIHSLRAHIGAMFAALGRLDALVFTGGVGERSPAVRAAAAEPLRALGIAVDAKRNAGVGEEPAAGVDAEPGAGVGEEPAAGVDAEPGAGVDADVSAIDAGARTLVIRAREDLVIAGEVRAVLARGDGGRPSR